MITKIKWTLIVLAIVSGLILAILFIQDRTKKLEDRKYKEINDITIATDAANVNIYKAEDEQVRVVVYGSVKDFVEIIEGTKSLTISKMTGNTKCLLNCKNELDIYVPESINSISIKSEKGNINSDTKVNIFSINSKIGNVNLYKANIANIRTEIGNVNIVELNGTNGSTIVTEVGNVSISKIINLKIDAKSEVGSVVIPVIKDEQQFTLKIETSKGNIDIDHHENKSE